MNYWTDVTLPNGQDFGPLFSVTFALQPYMEIDVIGLTQNVPALAPPGTYTFHGHVGWYPNAQVSDSFEFEKTGGAAGAIAFDPAQWPAGGTWAAGDAENAPVSLPGAFALSGAHPNPFNPSTAFTVTLPEAAELAVEVFNTAGQRVATLADGSYSGGEHLFVFDGSGLASGLYLVRAHADRFGTRTAKALLMK
ncbi:MAG: hypothetical protein MAG453_01465 [Calditrichaeota bacterium]|nr:hypothetical protein [Calditrichota bacterium]